MAVKKSASPHRIEKLVARQREEASREGLHQQFHPNGRLFREWTVVASKIVGVLRVWDENGTLLREEPMKHGLVHGIVRQWNSKGSLLGEYKMEMGKGVVREWNEDGSLAMETERLSEHAMRTRIYEDPKTTHEVFLWNDTPVSKRKFYRMLKLDAVRRP
jgi:antitoxin component YwqK of YwqJK toxin-antitoxin module